MDYSLINYYLEKVVQFCDSFLGKSMGINCEEGDVYSIFSRSPTPRLILIMCSLLFHTLFPDGNETPCINGIYNAVFYFQGKAQISILSSVAALLKSIRKKKFWSAKIFE